MCVIKVKVCVYSPVITYYLVFQPKHCYYKMKGLIDYLLYNIDDEVILPKIYSHGLLTNQNKRVILNAPNDWQTRWLLLQCIIHFKSLAVLTFCRLVQQSQPETFHQLIRGMYVS